MGFEVNGVEPVHLDYLLFAAYIERVRVNGGENFGQEYD